MKHITRIFAVVFFCVFALGTFGLLYLKGIAPESFYTEISASKLEPLSDIQPVSTRVPFSNSNLSLAPNFWQFIPIVVKGSQSGGDVTPGPLTVSGSNPRLLVTANMQEPVLLVGDAAWSMIAQLTTPEIDTYLEDRQSRGFNMVLVNLLEHHFATNAPNNINDDAPFTGTNFITPNEDYFVHADYAVQKAASLGIYVLLNPLYLGFGLGSEGWGQEVLAATEADMRDWGEYVGARYRKYDNLVWVIGADADPTSVIDKVNAFVVGLLSKDDRHLLTFHDVRGTMAISNVGENWLTLNNIYSTYLDTANLAQTAYSVTPAMPFFQIEGWYENEHSMTAQNLRAQAYWTVLGGGVGHIFGNNPIWKFAYDGGDWEAELDQPGSIGMAHLGNLFNAVAWYELVPDGSHNLITSGYGTLGSADFAGAGINDDGTLAVIYMPSNRTMTVDMSLFSGTVTARWYDPTSGQYEDDPASPLYDGGMHNFSHPGKNADDDPDWVLVFEEQ